MVIYISFKFNPFTGNLDAVNSGGVTNHASLTNLNWNLSGHEGTANKFAGFDSDGNASELDIDLSGYVPYTGATRNVDLGSHNLTTTGNFVGTKLLFDDYGASSSYIDFATGQINFVANGIQIFDFDGGSGGQTNFRVPVNMNTNNITGAGTITADYFIGDGSLLENLPSPDLSGYIPYTGATINVDLGSNNLETTGAGRFDGGVGVGTDPSYPFHLQMASDDTNAFYVDGVTTPYSSWASNWNYAPFKQHSKLTGSGSVPGFDLMLAQMIDNQLTQEFVLTGSPLAGILQNKGIYNYVRLEGSHDASTIVAFVEDNFGIHNFVDERPREISAFGSSLNRIQLVGILNEVKTSPIFDYNHAGTTLEKEMIGEDIWVQALQHSATAGTLNLNAYGIKMLVSASTSATTSNAYGLYFDNFQATHDLYGIYMNEDDTNLKHLLAKDNQKTMFGTSEDASIYFDNSDFIINSENITANDEVHFTNFDKYTFDNDIESTGYISGKKSGVHAYLGTPTNSTITTANTYQAISGTFTNSPIENFSAATTNTPGIKYDGSKTQHFEIDWHTTIKASGNNTTVHFSIYKNGSIDTGSIMGTFCKNLNQPYALSGTSVIELEEDDEIQLMITSDGTGDVITVEHYTTTISEFFD